MTVRELYNYLSEKIPSELSCEWDNDGLMCCPAPDREVRKVLVTLDVSEEMVELAKKFIDKECVIYAFDSGHQFVGVVKEVNDGAILLETNGALEAINLDFVIRIREYPRKKNGKKKSVVLD